jgi:maleylpyruvate isomerase
MSAHPTLGDVQLYGYWRSSASYRTRIGLALKGVAYETIAVHLIKNGGEQHSSEWKAKNPMEQVPLLVFNHGGRRVELTQSIAILEYLDETIPEPPLMPKDAFALALVRRSVEVVNSGVQPLQNLSTMDAVKKLGGDAKAFAVAAIHRGLETLEKQASETGGKCLFGDEPTLADVCLVPQMYAARRFGADLPRFPRLVAIDAHLAALPTFAAAHPDRQPDAEPTL